MSISRRMNPIEIEEAIWKKASANYAAKGKTGRRASRCVPTSVTSCSTSSTRQWKDHLLSIDHVKQGIGLVGYGQKDPLVEYKKQSLRYVSGHARPHRHEHDQGAVSSRDRTQDEQEEMRTSRTARTQRARRQAAGMAFTGAMAAAEAAGAEAARHTPFVRDTPKMKPNDPCYCGSGRSSRSATEQGCRLFQKEKRGRQTFCPS